jgi:hypothetical protein
MTGEQWVRRMGQYLRSKQTKGDRKVIKLYDVFVNIPNAFTRVRVEAEGIEDAAEKAVEKVQREHMSYEHAFSRWVHDETGNTPRPKRPHKWTHVVTASDVEKAEVRLDEGDVGEAIGYDEEG